jgi:hypothetical protein
LDVVENACIATIARGDKVKGSGKNTEPETQTASIHGLSGVTELTLVADWSAEGPTTSLLIELSKAA